MSFDARSLERLQALGRQLPKPLPRPEPAQGTPARPQEKQHAIEREEDPDQLFRELMQASPDGTVPPHLLDRLRELELDRSAHAAARPSQAPGPAGSTPTAAAGRQGRGRGRTTRPSRPPAASADDQSLYAAFEDLLHLEADEQADLPTPADDRRRRPPQIQLQPKPTQRLAQEGR